MKFEESHGSTTLQLGGYMPSSKHLFRGYDSGVSSGFWVSPEAEFLAARDWTCVICICFQEWNMMNLALLQNFDPGRDGWMICGWSRRRERGDSPCVSFVEKLRWTTR